MKRQTELEHASSENEPTALAEYDDWLTRQLVETIRVVSKDMIVVTIKGGIGIRQMLSDEK